ncbi:lymphocyte function-associated antigen 3 [Brienomyrus brachyistius]|uniref:lymphocyte function-associated antigen 3 n=1 Tax=Brienomyrus brachyistius TaxID=42636 RepID=UPI0020B3D583|nr:lymphocyte function-associated antigen 3 [Brienomyrus brachyistius]
MENSRIVIFEKYYVFLIFLILLDSIFGDTAVQRIYGELNGNITLRPGVTGTIKEILWKHNGDKAAEFTRPDPVQSYRNFQYRVILNINTGHLTITKLNYEDNGQYMAESQLDEKQQLQYYTVNLIVIEPITLPIVQCRKNETAAKLLCSAKGPNLQYSWRGGSISTPTWSPEPTELVIKKEDDPDSIYTCLVKSEASSRSSEAYKVAECSVGSSLSRSIAFSIVGVAVVVAIGAIVAVIKYCQRRQGTNYHEVQQNPDIESNRNKNDQDPSSSGNYPPNTGRETEERTNAGTGARKALPGSKMNEMVLTDRKKQMHETERAANQEGKGNVKYESPSEVKDDKKPNKTDEEKEDLLQKGTTQGDVKQEEKKMDAIVLNKDKNGVKKTDSQEEGKDQREEENIEPQDEDEAQKVEEKKTDPQKENKDHKEEKTDPQKENKDRKEEKTYSQAKDKDQKEEEKKNDPQEEDKAQKEEEKKPDPQNENKDCKEEKTDSQAKDKDQKGEEKQGEENRNS